MRVVDVQVLGEKLSEEVQLTKQEAATLARAAKILDKVEVLAVAKYDGWGQDPPGLDLCLAQEVVEKLAKAGKVGI